MTTPGEKMVLYLNPLDEWCTNIDYFTYLLKLGEITPKRLSDEGQIWLHFARKTNLMLTLAFLAKKSIGICMPGIWHLPGMPRIQIVVFSPGTKWSLQTLS